MGRLMAFMPYLKFRLHSTLVRFMVFFAHCFLVKVTCLHSTLVRFMERLVILLLIILPWFTFHSGKIHGLHRSQPKACLYSRLHSTLVRFMVKHRFAASWMQWWFTFHSGKIHGLSSTNTVISFHQVYIPLW